MEGITWIGCGAKLPVIDLADSYDVTIRNCTFQHSLYQAVRVKTNSLVAALTVNINHCNFLNSNHHKDHGAAIHLKHYFTTASAAAIAINNCNFSYNGDAKSLVYINFDDGTLELINTSLHDNQGVSIYVLNSVNLYINGQVIFENNVAEKGAGIYISGHSNIMFGKNSDLKFINNSVTHNGAIIFLNNHSTVLFDQNYIITGEIMFEKNAAKNGAGIYMSDHSTIIFDKIQI